MATAGETVNTRLIGLKLFVYYIVRGRYRQVNYKAIYSQVTSHAAAMTSAIGLARS